MKRFYYVFLDDNNCLGIDFLNTSRYEDALRELNVNNIRYLFVSSYYTPLSRYLFKFFKLLITYKNDDVIAQISSYADWKVVKPYLYFNRKNKEYSVSDTMIFGDYSLEFVGYVSDKSIQELLIQNDF